MIMQFRIGKLLEYSISRIRKIALDNDVDISTYRNTIQKKASRLRADPVQTEFVVLEYKENLHAMVEKAVNGKVPVLLFTVPSNLGDWRPHVSFSASIGQARINWLKIFYRRS